MLNSKMKNLRGSWFLTSLKGNQEKNFENGIWFKRDYFPQESVAEVLVSEFLESSGEVDFVKYWLGDLTNISCSRSFKDKNEYYLPFTKMLSVLGIDVDVWINRYYSKATVQGRYALVKSVYLKFGFTEYDVDLEFSRMIKLDFLMMNVDRHLRNFGIVWDRDLGLVRFVPLFDNGLSLGVGVDGLTGSRLIQRALKNTTKVKPFSRIPKKNLSVVPFDYMFKFDVHKFLEVHDSRIDLTYTSFVVFLERLCEMLVVDCNGVDLREVFIKAFGDWRFLLVER